MRGRSTLAVIYEDTLFPRAVAHKVGTFQWQDGKKVIVWPEELAPGKPRFPPPPWNQR